MGKFTSILWTLSTLNLIWGCTKVSDGCGRCYMYRLSKQFGRNPEVVTFLRSGKDPAYMRQSIKGLGEKIFVNSMSDTFHESVPLKVIDTWFTVMAEFPDKQFQVLTKRINRVRLFAKAWRAVHGDWPANIWLGTSIEDQAHLFRAKTLKDVVGPKIKFISFEPLLGAIINPDLSGIQWAIVGGESGLASENPRNMELEWAELIRVACERQAVAFVYKQKGGVGGDGTGGDYLYGKQYHEFPQYSK